MKRPIRIEGDVAFVPLTRGHEAIIDAEDVPTVAPYSWSAMVTGPRIYAVTSINGRTVYMRQMMTKAARGRRPPVPGHSLDCRKAALGIVGALADVVVPRRRKPAPRQSPGRPFKQRLAPRDPAFELAKSPKFTLQNSL